MPAIIFGLVFIGLGVYGAAHWWPSAARWMRDFLMVSLIFGGLIGVLAGLSAFKKK